jgi:hypothetical protein
MYSPNGFAFFAPPQKVKYLFHAKLQQTEQKNAATPIFRQLSTATILF